MSAVSFACQCAEQFWDQDRFVAHTYACPIWLRVKSMTPAEPAQPWDDGHPELDHPPEPVPPDEREASGWECDEEAERVMGVREPR